MNTRSRLLACSLCLLAPSLHAAEPFLRKTTLFESEKDGYERYRIPGIAITGKGTILVTCDARKVAALAELQAMTSIFTPSSTS